MNILPEDIRKKIDEQADWMESMCREMQVIHSRVIVDEKIMDSFNVAMNSKEAMLKVAEYAFYVGVLKGYEEGRNPDSAKVFYGKAKYEVKK